MMGQQCYDMNNSKKNFLKHSLSRNGFYPGFDLIRHLPEIVHWICKGCSGIAPPPIKRKAIMSYLRSHGMKVFVETGTHLGDTLAGIAHDKSIQAISIELADEYYLAAKLRFAGYRNVELFHGDSGKLMPEIISKLKNPALFWLDGHYSGGHTAKGDLETPVSAELKAILASPVKGHVILIDDARCFNGSHDYPHLDQILTAIRSNGRYHIEVAADILRLTPKH